MKPGVKLLIGSIIFVGMNVLTARATVKFIKAKQEADHEMTMKENIVLGVKCYGFVVGAGILAAKLVLDADNNYNQINSGLAAGYNVISHKYAGQKDVIINKLGLDKFKEIAKDSMKVPDIKKSFARPVSEGCVLMMDPFSDPKNPVFVETTDVQIVEANLEFIRRIIVNDKSNTIVTVNEWRELQGFDDIDMQGEEFGWSQEYLEDMNNHSFLDIVPVIKFDEKGQQYYYPEFRYEPCAGNSRQLQAL